MLRSFLDLLVLVRCFRPACSLTPLPPVYPSAPPRITPCLFTPCHIYTPYHSFCT
ncbi:hypothetical protein AG1IA_04006 [Rhizoctonia solani AG-1 IA]|uniref:Uncharacterized protein n=1 Tax=Thanatephorus cucumeris (strain AG1-IA) TaxID=983506 RepID=L8WVD5_THACA|nr:hypothetical protein AG1IA_04006 [Rhizoctonia solani AG-1 IA]